MSGLPFAALVLCLCITAGESQQFTITVEHSQINVPVGSDALFSVRPSSKVRSGDWSVNGTLVVRWVDQTVSVDNEYTSRAELFTSNGSLLLKSVNVRDSGEYRVNMVPVSGSQSSATITLRVSAFTEPVTGVTVVSNDSTPLENLDTIVLSCDASGTVQTRTWFKDNQPIQENGRIFTSPDKAKLTIVSVNRNDAGTYKCIASNSFSSGAGETYVQVYSPKGDDRITLTAGGIVGIVLGLLGMGLIGGVSGWFIARKAGGIKDPAQSKHDTSTTSGRKGTVDTNTADASQNYENFPRNEQGARYNERDGNTTYTITSPVNGSGRLAGCSHIRRTTIVEETTGQNDSHFLHTTVIYVSVICLTV
ncbi:carcinoembryonic antigen-related cell adhesion molecule 5-like isoform X1 [Mobula hypostoma]|uniref:carcinoembryonic antigen-related cell adhesion molecule 5-like isoform X1 n=1 Tax=Mobula hypostoma TaxID=723540 RepID=UPI002FC31B0F